MIPSLYADVMQRIRTHHMHEIAKEQERFEYRRKWHSERLEGEQDALTKAVTTFMELGVFMPALPSYIRYSVATNNRGGRWRSHEPLISIMRDLARELKRPFVQVYGNAVQWPRQKRLQVLALPFVLVAGDEPTYTNSHTYDPSTKKLKPVIRPPVVRETAWSSIERYYFHGEHGATFRALFLEHIKTPECRRALKLV